jgi:hypothetical protein
VYHSIQDYVSRGFDGSWTEVADKYIQINSAGQQCHAAGRNLSIMQNGDVQTCFQQDWILGCEKPLGNLNYDSIQNILQQQYVQSVFEKMCKCDHPCKVLKCNIK